MAATEAETAEKARVSGNEFYKAGQLAQAERAYQIAEFLAPQDPAPVSNLSAVKYEMGDYQGSITHIKQALALGPAGIEDGNKKDKLNVRLAKCFLHLRDIIHAKDAIFAVGNQDLGAELSESLNSILALQADVPEQSILRRQTLDHVPQYKSWLSNIAEYYACGHDQVEYFAEPIGFDTGGKKCDVSMLFAGCGDGRNVFAALTSMCFREEDKTPTFRNLRITMLDLKHAALAKTLILFNMMYQIDKAMILPPFVQSKLQYNIVDLIERLEAGEKMLPFVHLSDGDKTAVIRVLRQWQKPWPMVSKPADVREIVKLKTPTNHPLDGHPFRPKKKEDTPEKKDFKKFAALFPSEAAAKQWEPALGDALAEYRKTGKDKKLSQHIDSTWAVNNTVIDYDFADYGIQIGDGGGIYMEFDPLAVEMIAGEMTDIMERIRYNMLDHRHSGAGNPHGKGLLDPTEFPLKYDYVHMSNIPDYVGGHLTTFLVTRPLLREDSRSCMRFNNLLNPPEFENHEAFQSEYLLMHDMAQIRKHFHVDRRAAPTNPSDEFFKSMMGSMISPFAFESDMTWQRQPKTQMSYKELLPRAAFEKWMQGHFLKICVPYPRPIYSGAPVHAPLNLNSLIRLMISMFETGYPAHWLLRILSQFCSGTITTTARPPTHRVTTSAAADATYPPKEMSLQPWVAEFTTLLSIWRALIPFGVDSLGGTLVPLASINQYSIDFPRFRAENERLPHFIRLFWNTELGYTLTPPSDLHSLLSGVNGGNRSHTSPRELLEKAIVCVSAFHYTAESRTALFLMRADTMENMKAGKWRAFILRTDAWQTVTYGVDVSQKVVMRQNWATLV